jgi:hypothetical protein
MNDGCPNDTAHVDAARAGADIEVTAQDPPDDLPGSQLDQQTVDCCAAAGSAREAARP